MRDLRRWVLAGLGVAATGVGAVGVFVPGLPTTIFLLLASYCFARSCPWLEERLLRTRLFAPYLPWLEGTEPLPRRAKLGAIASMWAAVTISLGLLLYADRLGRAVAFAVVAAAVAGTVVIAGDVVVRLRRRRSTLAVEPVAEKRSLSKDELLTRS
jgi:uncharacterized membrane protein YbaN (DUF454 family)